MIGGTAPGEGNVIAFNAGYLATPPAGIVNVGAADRDPRQLDPRQPALGIDLNAATASTPNDPGDADTGPNSLQNFPIIAVGRLGASSDDGPRQPRQRARRRPTTSTSTRTRLRELPEDFLEGQTYLGTAPVTTDGAGTPPSTSRSPVAIEAGGRITATATDPDRQHLGVLAADRLLDRPRVRAAGGRHARHARRHRLRWPGATVTIGGAAGDRHVRRRPHRSPRRRRPSPPGTVNDVVVTNTDGTTGTLVKGWVVGLPRRARRPAVPRLRHDARLATRSRPASAAAIYGVDQPTLRQQMAVFLLKARHGLCYVPPPCTAGSSPTCPARRPSPPGSTRSPPRASPAAAAAATTARPTRSAATRWPSSCSRPSTARLRCRRPARHRRLSRTCPCPSARSPTGSSSSPPRTITGGCGGGNYCPRNRQHARADGGLHHQDLQASVDSSGSLGSIRVNAGLVAGRRSAFLGGSAHAAQAAFDGSTRRTVPRKSNRAGIGGGRGRRGRARGSPSSAATFPGRSRRRAGSRPPSRTPFSRRRESPRGLQAVRALRRDARNGRPDRRRAPRPEPPRAS